MTGRVSHKKRQYPTKENETQLAASLQFATWSKSAVRNLQQAS